MLIVKKCPFSGYINRWEIPVTEAQLKSWNDGALIQNAMPNLSAEQREFIMTGITPTEWKKTFDK